MDFSERVKILTEGAKYDVSCSSSGSDRGGKAGMLGTAAACGICHSFTADGRCVSLLKILLTNKCEYDCLYCVNRRGNDIPRAAIEPEELCALVMDFYRRNYIEGLFLSSAVQISPDYTMQRLTRAVQLLREQYGFNGYIHLKAIPAADNALIDLASQYVDRMSINIELPSEQSLKILAPQKKKAALLKPMKMLADTYIQNRQEKLPALNATRGITGVRNTQKHIKKIPAGQTTQMIVGASGETDGQIIRLTEALYTKFELKRVYYSAYMPLGSSDLLPAIPPNLVRENRLYQADWLLRFYGFNADELIPPDVNFDLSIDPKCDWALRNIHLFPVEINTVPYDMLLRIPGIGVKNAFRIAEARKHSSLSLEGLKRMRVVLKRALNFITVNGKFYGTKSDPTVLRHTIALSESEPEQLAFELPAAKVSRAELEQPGKIAPANAYLPGLTSPTDFGLAQNMLAGQLPQSESGQLDAFKNQLQKTPSLTAYPATQNNEEKALLERFKAEQRAFVAAVTKNYALTSP